MTDIGFIGTGVITEAVVSGLCTLAEPPTRITVSPRNAERARSLSSRFRQVSVAADNQSVVNVSDVVCIAVRPEIAAALLGELGFRQDQSIVSFVATVPIVELRELVAPATRICRMVPMPPVADHLGPIALCPPNEKIATLFGGIGTVTQVDDEKRLHTLWAVTAMVAPFFGLLHEMSAWLEARNIEPYQARRYVGSMIHALSVTAKRVGDGGFERLIDEHSTPKGLNEQALRELKSAGWGVLIPKVLNLIAKRLNGRADFESRMP
ncbi:MAG: NAD(P)-binding domain-containing protein [Kiloniellaceae bacterium]